ncbi:MAG TPA: helix-turn-helix domain-containing protein [Ilumatobacteraceae bacterium]|nr:helix-turn-helix domain-containing protein [Ilumatobacteraceae bacterium]HRB02239.1 helix-turn-helix domain-containing protein [Ilumatobacteraceae bacterium]
MTNKPESNRTDPPDFLTVEEAAAVLRIGRTSAYRQARKFIATNGSEGLCADRFGKQIRIPRCHLEQRLGGPITWPIFTDETPVASAVASITPTPSAQRTTRRASRPPDQDALPFSA